MLHPVRERPRLLRVAGLVFTGVAQAAEAVVIAMSGLCAP
jgi:hypothetical protein